MNFKRKILLSLICIISMGLHAQNQKPLSRSRIGNGNDVLGQSYLSQNVCGMNFVSASVLTETRTIPLGYNNNGTGFPTVLSVSGLPAGYTLQNAYIYFGASYTEANPPSAIAVITNPNNTTANLGASLIGQAGAVCFGETGTASYRADISSIISGNGSYEVNITGFSNVNSEVDGVTIIIIYVDPSATYSGNIAIWDGCVSTTSGPIDNSLTGISPCTNSSIATGFGIYGSISAKQNNGTNTDVFNGTTGTFGNDFWQMNSMTVTNLVECQSSLSYKSYTNNGSGCYFISALGMYWQYSSCSACAALTLSVTDTNPDCTNNNGSITVYASGGTQPYTYTWSPNVGTTASITGLSAGTYTITVHDVSCSSDTISVSLGVSPVTLVDSVISEVSCNGGDDGSAQVTASGAMPPYAYVWSDGNTGSTDSGLTAGTGGTTYTVTVSDINGCSTTATVSIYEPPADADTGSVISNVTCFGGNSGSVQVIANGPSPYSYLWNTGETYSSISGLTAGTGGTSYIVVVTDGNGCTTAVTVIISEAPQITAEGFVLNSVSCGGGSNGSVEVLAEGGNSPYTYLWNNGDTTTVASGLTAGTGGTTYTVTVTDNNGCTSTGTVAIIEAVPVTGTITVLSYSSGCVGASDGRAEVSGGGGTSPYTYIWSNKATTTVISGLSVGNYTVTITDIHGCTGIASVTISAPGQVIAVDSVISNVSPCFGGSTGIVQVRASSGSAPYTYLWNNGDITSTISGLTAGTGGTTYSVTVTDITGCMNTATVSISEPAQITAKTSLLSKITCFNDSNGNIEVTAGGGTAPYSYLWNNGAVTSSVTGLSGGTGGTIDTVTVTDNNGCIATATISISEPSEVTLTPSVIRNVTCSGSSTGNVEVVTAGGTSPYTYKWSDAKTTSSISGLTAGTGGTTYSIMVTDNHGCSSTASVTITEPTPLALTPSVIGDVFCRGAATGSATVSVSGGNAPYTYLWNPGARTAATATGLSAGTITITVHDNNDCSATATISITQPATGIVATLTITDPSCGKANGMAIVTVSGGVLPYTYRWSDARTTTGITGLSAGDYTVTVTGNDGCTSTASVAAAAIAPPLVFAFTTVNDICFGESTGVAESFSFRGTAPYTYSWNPVGGTAEEASGLSAGDYTLSVTDHSGCLVSASVAVTQPTEINATITVTNALCISNVGVLHVAATGGTPAYTYSWSPGGQTVNNITGLSAGTYSLNITDHNGCVLTSSATVNTINDGLNASLSSFVNIICFGSSNGSASISASGGTSPYTFSWNPSGGTSATATGLYANSYTVTVTDAGGCNFTVSVTLTQPAAALTDTITSSTNNSCFGSSNGSATVSGIGGTAPYTFKWSPSGGTGTTATGLVGGNYTVSITDAQGCTNSTSVGITQPPTLTDSITGTNITCYNENNGTATVIQTGGTQPYVYLWTPSAIMNVTATGLSAGTYSVTVTDALGCITSASITLTQPTLLTANISSQVNITCFGGDNGSATATATGGTGKYSYSWAPSGGTTAKATALVSGTYTLTVTDGNGCTSTVTVTLTEPTMLSNATTIIENVSCNGDKNGSATIGVIGGTTPYTYSWNPSGQSTITATGLTAGTYTSTVNDANGCIATASITITQPLTLSSTTSSTVAMCGHDNGSATVTVAGGTTPYKYSWIPSGQTSSNATGLSGGTYMATITDANSCTATVAVTVISTPAVTGTAQVLSDVACNGDNTGSAEETPQGGTFPFSYSWSPRGGTGEIANGLTAGTYTVLVTDANGCQTSDEVTITQPPKLIATQVTTDVSCYGDDNGIISLNVNGGTAPYNYQWTSGAGTGALVSGLSAGTYTVIITDANSCNITEVITVTQPLQLDVNNNIINTDCYNTPTGSVQANPNGGTSPYAYLWSNGSTSQSIFNLSVGKYRVVVTDFDGCKYVDTLTVGYDTAVTAFASDTVTCSGIPVVLNASQSTNATNFIWYQLPGMKVIDKNVMVTVSPSTGENDFLLVAYSGNCISTDTVIVTVNPASFANAGLFQQIYVGNSANLGGTPTGPSGADYKWRPSTGLNDSIEANPTASPTTTTTYTVIATNLSGCIAADTVTIEVLPGIFIPAGFTPNGDGINDFWVIPYSDNFPNMEVEIYNRWGQKVYSSKGYASPWDGTYNGKPLPVGTYYYIVNFNNPTFPHAYTGPVTIFR